MENKIKLKINKKSVDLNIYQFYTIETSIESIEELLLLNSNLNSAKTVIINSFSKLYNTILVFKYFKENKTLLKTIGFDIKLGVTNSKCFKLLISNEVHKYDTIFVNTIGLGYEEIKELQKYLINLSNKKMKTIFLVNYSSNNKKNIQIYDESSRLIEKL